MALVTFWVICLFVGAILVTRLIGQPLLSPLRKIPGPWYAQFTSVVLKCHELRANRTRYLHRLHLQYGPVVRIAPYEVAFASSFSVKEIYCSGGSGYDKTEFYDLFRVYGRRTMFTTLGKEAHAKRKRALADRYANTNVQRAPSLQGIAERAANFANRCRESVGGSLDLFVNLHSYAFDGVTHHLFHPHGGNSLLDKGDEAIMREVAFDDSLQTYYNPALHHLIEPVLNFFAKPRETPLADNFVLESSSKTDTAPFTLLNRLKEKGTSLELMDAAAECLDHMAAGIDTTGDGLCFLMWELSQPRARPVQKRLQAELQANPTASFDKLGYLDAVILEGLRCFPPIPMSLPRYVPHGGRIIDGYFIPARTIVSCQAYSVHRLDERVFPRSDVFDPDRWLQDEGDTERKRLFFAFANGGRGCIGKHLALTEMKLLLRAVYSEFTTLPDPSMTAEEMEMADQLISTRPAGERCLVQFVPIDTSSAPRQP